MDSKERLRWYCLSFLKFLELDLSTDSLGTWEERISEYIRKFTQQIEFDLNNCPEADLPRGNILAQLSTLAILISEEFDVSLEAVVTGEWEHFDRLFTDEKEHYESRGRDWHDYRTRKIFWWFNSLSRWVKQADERTSAPARELELWEKRLWCEEISQDIPRTIAPFEADEDPEAFKQRYKEANRLHLSIDPFAPVEVIVEKVEEIVKQHQEATYKDYIASFQHEMNQGVFDIEDVQRWAEEDRLRYDDLRGDQGRRSGTLKGKTSSYLQWLKIYRLKRGKYSPEEIAKVTGVPKDWEAHLKENKVAAIRREQDKQRGRARKLIQAALRGKSPLTVSIS
nr:hypothetical protein [uncultured Desulfobulbus sp.]